MLLSTSVAQVAPLSSSHTQQLSLQDTVDTQPDIRCMTSATRLMNSDTDAVMPTTSMTRLLKVDAQKQAQLSVVVSSKNKQEPAH